MTHTFIEKSDWEDIEREFLRADRFIRQCESVRKYALAYKDHEFFVNLAYQKAFQSQVRYIQGAPPCLVVDSLGQAIKDFITGFELGYPAEAVEINNWFHRSLIVKDISLSRFFAVLPDEFWPSGDAFSRFQAHWGFAQFLGHKEQIPEILEAFNNLCIETGDVPISQRNPQRFQQIQWNIYHLMHSVFEGDSSSFAGHLNERVRLNSIIPLEGTRYERFHPLDFLCTGLCRIATLNGIEVPTNLPSIPIKLLEVFSS